MAGGKGKSTGGKAGPKEVPGKSQKSHSAKAGLQVRFYRWICYSQDLLVRDRPSITEMDLSRRNQ